MDNYLGDSYEKISNNKTIKLLRQYSYFIQQAETGNITALCIKIDLDNALNTVLTKEEKYCIELYLIEGYVYEEVRKKMGISNGTARNRVRTGVNKITNCLKGGF